MASPADPHWLIFQASALYTLSMAYRFGLGVPASRKIEEKCLKTAASLGSFEARTRLYYSSGLTRSSDVDRAHRRCVFCMDEKAALVPCGACGSVYYCSRFCQELHRHMHGPICKLMSAGDW